MDFKVKSVGGYISTRRSAVTYMITGAVSVNTYEVTVEKLTRPPHWFRENILSTHFLFPIV